MGVTVLVVDGEVEVKVPAVDGGGGSHCTCSRWWGLGVTVLAVDGEVVVTVLAVDGEVGVTVLAVDGEVGVTVLAVDGGGWSLLYL